MTFVTKMSVSVVFIEVPSWFYDLTKITLFMSFTGESLFMMKRLVKTFMENLKVFRTIISFNSIYMMNYFPRLKFTVHQLFHKFSMKSSSLTFNLYSKIAMTKSSFSSRVSSFFKRVSVFFKSYVMHITKTKADMNSFAIFNFACFHVSNHTISH